VSRSVRITHRRMGILLAEGPLGWAITPFLGNYYISRRYLRTRRFKSNFLPGVCPYKFLYVWLDLVLEDGSREKNLGSPSNGASRVKCKAKPCQGPARNSLNPFRASGYHMIGPNSMSQLTTTIACPHCHFRATEGMPTNQCQFFYECRNCRTILRPKPGECCVYCSYADRPCPPVQESLASSGA